MYYLLFTIYLTIGCFFITRISFIKQAGLATRLLLALFLLKISAGVLIGWMSQKFYPQGSDYWGLNVAGWNEYQLMLSDPKRFFTDIFSSAYQNGYDGFFRSTGSYWNDLKNNLIIKTLACCNIFTRGNYYINSLFFNFVGFFAHVALYRVFADIFRNKKWPVIIGCFLLPSTLYFSSGIHKDLVVFTLLGFYAYALYFSFRNKLTVKYLFTISLTLFALLLVRNFVAIALFPTSIAFIICKKTKFNRLAIFMATYLTVLSILLLVQLVKPSFQPLKIITQKQRDFFELPYATSQLDTHVLEPNYKSLAKNMPQAMNHSMLRPYLWEHPTNFLIPLALELFIYQALFIIMLIWYQKNDDPLNAFILFGVFLSISLLLFTGYIVPNTGSIVRYRSLYLPFLITPVLCLINWKKLSIRTH
ncbi:MAG: hypothetical protein ABI741_03885 [Ferruginibacter sp.]